MKRSFGMMPRSEVEIEKRYKDEGGRNVLIQAGLHGWTIVWGDMSSDFNDNDATPEENFKAAYNIVVNGLGALSKGE